MSEQPERRVVESVTVEIDAPADFVWEVLLDYERYPEWNPYTVRVESTRQIGEPVDLYLPDPNKPGELLHNREWITVIDRPRHYQYVMRERPDVPGLTAIRDQWIEEVAPDRCTYRTTDTFEGPLATMVMDYQGQWVKDGFDSVARALKERAEQLWDQRDRG